MQRMVILGLALVGLEKHNFNSMLLYVMLPMSVRRGLVGRSIVYALRKEKKNEVDARPSLTVLRWFAGLISYLSDRATETVLKFRFRSSALPLAGCPMLLCSQIIMPTGYVCWNQSKKMLRKRSMIC